MEITFKKLIRSACLLVCLEQRPISKENVAMFHSYAIFSAFCLKTFQNIYLYYRERFHKKRKTRYLSNVSLGKGKGRTNIPSFFFLYFYGISLFRNRFAHGNISF